MARKTGIQLDLDMAYMSLLKGKPLDLAQGTDVDWVSVLEFVVDPESNIGEEGTFEVEHENKVIQVTLSRLSSPKDDPIMRIAGNWDFGVARSGLSNVPFVAFTDNRGSYPCFLVRVIFPYRLANWVDPDHPTGIRMNIDPESAEIGGLPQSEDKIEALKVFNKLSKTGQIGESRRTLRYDDVTVFLESYFKGGARQPTLQKVMALASQSAFKDAVEDYYLDGFDQAKLKSAVAHFASLTKFGEGKIADEAALLDAVSEAIDEVLIHHVEDRNWIDAFWDGERKVKVDGEVKVFPRKPKGERQIQPTLHVVLDMALRPLGVQVVRESDEGTGLLDFRFLYTSANGTPLTVGAEFKLAHHKKIKHGVRRQLPAYLKAIKSQSGVFAVMWFKDKKSKHFGKPKNYEKDDFLSWLTDEAKEVTEDGKFTIIPSVIDASIRESASKL